MRKKDYLSIFFIICIIFFIIFYYEVYLKVPEQQSLIYSYNLEDENSQNKDLLLNFVENSNNHLKNSFYMRYDSTFEEDVLYGIKYENDIFTVYTLTNEKVYISEQEFLYLKEVVFNDETYYVLTNEENLQEEDIEQYFNGENIFSIFELGKK